MISSPDIAKSIVGLNGEALVFNDIGGVMRVFYNISIEKGKEIITKVILSKQDKCKR